MTLSLHTLMKTPGSKRRRMRVGRGESSGKGRTSGKGNKGQMSRTGHKHKPAFEGGQMRLIRRIPKRGFTSVAGTEYLPVNVVSLARFKEGTEVTVDLLRKEGLAHGSTGLVKILGSGEMKTKLVVKAHAFSASAKSKIEAAGGTCEIVK
jgi:large subunit ribosomal protein L15